ncbi:MAG: winged helix-turn-helix domain-containing protein [Bacillota bacterium]
MTSGRFCFDRFELDAADRQLIRDGAPVELNSRYLDALALLVSERGKLVSKERFLDEVWRGVPVTDEALTQCIKTLRRQLGDEAGRPRFIETVPKHGYRFIAPVDEGRSTTLVRRLARFSWREFLLLGAAGTIGGGMAGLLGGLFYGFAGASEPLQPGMGTMSVMIVILCLSILVALIGAAGVSFGIAAAMLADRPRLPWTVLGGAAGGMIVGAVVKLLGLDAFNLLFGRSPAGITGAGEGLLLGAGVGLGVWLAARNRDRAPLRRSMAAAGATGAIAGVLVIIAGGRLMLGSLALLAQTFPESRLRIERIGSLFGESGLGPTTRIVTGGLEAALFAACIAGAMIAARRNLSGRSIFG